MRSPLILTLRAVFTACVQGWAPNCPAATTHHPSPSGAPARGTDSPAPTRKRPVRHTGGKVGRGGYTGAAVRRTRRRRAHTTSATPARSTGPSSTASHTGNPPTVSNSSV